MNTEDLQQDAKLDESIQFPQPLSENWDAPDAVFLTGSTGFLGVYLLVELLRRTKATIYCLVRAPDAMSGMERIRQRMQFYGLWHEYFLLRIIPVPGDLAKVRLGLSEREFDELAICADVIYHNGAQVNAMYPYAQLKASNVSGTLEVLRLAGHKKTKPLNFISTLAVFFSDSYVGKVVHESEFATLDSGLKGGYKQSKWVAEALICAARARGLPAIIHRPGRIMADSQSGILDRFSDLLGNLLQGCIQLEQFPQVEALLNFAPVDYVSKAIVHLGQQPQLPGENFHICHPDSVTWHKLGQIIQEVGYPLEPVAFTAWKTTINQQIRTHPDRQLYLVLRHLLRSPVYLFSQKPEFSTHYTSGKLKAAGIHCPPVDAELLATYLGYFREIAALPPLPQEVSVS